MGTGGLAGAGLALGAVGAAGADESERPGERTRTSSIASSKLKYNSRLHEASSSGDRSWTWRWPLTGVTDAWSLSLPARLAPLTSLGARLLVDATYLRAIFGSAAVLLPLAGMALGVVAAAQVGAHALPPSFGLTVAIIGIGVADAAAGILAAVLFVAGVALQGGVADAAGLRTLLAIGALWFVIPLVAAAARPFRRPPAQDAAQRWDRAADFLIASLIGGWAVLKILGSLPGLSGYSLPLSSEAGAAAALTLLFMAGRLGVETLAAHLYPERLQMVQPARAPRAGLAVGLGGLVVRAALFVFVAVVAVGWTWQLLAGVALFAAPQLAVLFESRFRNIPRLYRILPRGVVKVVLVLIVMRLVAGVVLAAVKGSPQAIGDAFVLLALPGFVLAALELFGRRGDDGRLALGHRIAGLAVIAVGAAIVLGAFGP